MEKKEISGYGEGNYFLGSGNTDYNDCMMITDEVSTDMNLAGNYVTPIK